MDGFQNLFLRKLRERITAEISEREQVVLAGKLKDHATYLSTIEGIQVLKIVRDKFFEEVASELLEENRTGKRPRLHPTQAPDWSS